MKELKNIVIINDFDYVQGGASKVAIDTANLLCEKYNVYFFSGCCDDSSTLNQKVIKICTNQGESLNDKNKIRGALSGIYNFKARKELKTLLSKLDKDETIIHVHGWTKSLSSSVFDISWKMGFKLVLTMHDYFTACPNGGYFNYRSNKICQLKPLSCKCVCCDCDSRNYFIKFYRILRQFVQNRIVKLNKRLTNVISISEFSEKILKKTLRYKTKIFRVYNPIKIDDNIQKVDYKKNEYFLFVGRISKEKGVDIFCDAVTKANVKGIVVGDGPELKNLKNKYHNIKFVGWMENKDVEKYMKKAKALIFPSRWYEGAPLTPLEAIKFGIPIITSDCNAAVDYIKEDRNNYKFSIEKNDLSAKIKLFDQLNFDLKEDTNVAQIFNGNYCTNLSKVYLRIMGEK